MAQITTVNPATGEEIATFSTMDKNQVFDLVGKARRAFPEWKKDYENASDFYHCGNEDCERITFESALDGMFKCPSCGNVLNLKKNDKSKKAYSRKIDEIKKDMQQIF